MPRGKGGGMIDSLQQGEGFMDTRKITSHSLEAG